MTISGNVRAKSLNNRSRPWIFSSRSPSASNRRLTVCTSCAVSASSGTVMRRPTDASFDASSISSLSRFTRRTRRLLDIHTSSKATAVPAARIAIAMVMTVSDIQSTVCDTAKLVMIICYYWRPMSISNAEIRGKKAQTNQASVSISQQREPTAAIHHNSGRAAAGRWTACQQDATTERHCYLISRVYR